MSIAEISNEETGKITGILEAKWAQMTTDNSRLTAENKALNHALEIMTQDRNYWRERGEAGEHERDQERDRSEFMLRQWQGVQAIARETLNHEKRNVVVDEQTKLLGVKFGANSNIHDMPSRS